MSLVTYLKPTEAASTITPTSSDMVSVKVEMALASSLETPSVAQKDELRSSVLTTLQEESADIQLRDFTIVSTSNTRRRRHLLTAFTWKVFFTVLVGGAPNSAEFARATVEDTVMSSEFTNTINTAVTGASLTVDESSISIAVVTRAPTSDTGSDSAAAAPGVTTTPSSMDGGGGGKTEAASLGPTIVVSVLVPILVIGLLVWYKKRFQKAQEVELDPIEGNVECMNEKGGVITKSNTGIDAADNGWSSKVVSMDDFVNGALDTKDVFGAANQMSALKSGILI
jgi:hypothetical protein